ncbi:glycoside hydrolase family 3 N-terminal domain-containing protein [Catellatospora tritici]|uniref:beta-xylosidase/alpha-l-arabinosidase n=1 Tax=Catellatospora tritici TaxID=2851566 RepID=UPI001C2DDA7D|nr:glycoside hydrolase family 3 N-terminal domain-containing protein [Catellatospora tritici]MBV1849610.1 glycoside hydrolase family 3 C-terminal domain-containing protein [Catellatospora tritici]
MSSQPTQLEPWRDVALPAAERVADLMRRMTLAEKLGQLYAVWPAGGATGQDVAPFQSDMVDDGFDWRRLIKDGLGQLTRPYGTAPVSGADGARQLAELQEAIVAAGRFGIPALVHEECLTGFTAYGATIYPTPLAWGASFDAALVEQVGAAIGASMRALGVHQGLAPVLDVSRDARWGRTEETIGEDPYLVATVGTGYVRGLQSAGIVATLKHFAGYSASKAGRNFGPVGLGPRELADVLLPPFELAVRDGGARSVMHSYAEIDGIPAASDPWLLTTLLRDAWGFTGTVVADYFGVTFLQTLHHVAADHGAAAGLALAAGVDVELPMVRCYGRPLLEAIESGQVAEELVDRALRRVLRQKCELGLLDPDWTPTVPETVELDPAPARDLARRLAEESVVLLANDGTLPLRAPGTLALVGPLADHPDGMLGCYTFPRHVGLHHPGLPLGVEVPTLLASLRAELPDTAIAYAPGCDVRGDDTAGIGAAAQAAARAEACLLVLGDQAGLFGNGTSGEGCDVTELRLPGVQERLLEAVLDTGVPVVLVLLSGRPYALGAYADRLAAVVQAFFPGEEGGPALAGMLTGRVEPSGRLPVSVPRHPGGQPTTYLAPKLAHRSDVSTVDPTPLYPFGHGLSYTSFAWEPDTEGPLDCGTDGAVEVAIRVRNTGDRAGTEIVQLYLHDPVAQVTRPVVRLVGYARVPLEPGQARRVAFTVHADLSAFTGRSGQRIVEPGDTELRFGASSADFRHTVAVRFQGPQRTVGHGRVMTSEVVLEDL